MKLRRGSILLTVVVVLSVALLLVLTAATASTYTMRFNSAQDDHDAARNLAESAIYRSIAALQDLDSYGKARTEVVTVQGNDYRPNARGILSFHPGTAAGLGLHYSTNNLGTVANVTGDGRVVTHDTAHLVALGISGERRVELECLYYRPAFPKGAAATGTIRAEHLLLAGVRNSNDYDGDLNNVLSTNQLPASIFTNCAQATAVNVGVACNITGNVGAVGTVAVEAGSTVGGEIRQGASPQSIPNLNILDMINRVRSIQGLFPFNPALPLEDYAYVAGSSTITGDLVLQGGVLAVQGDLTVTGCVRGYGAVLVGGAATVQQGASLETGSQVVLAAHGDIDLRAFSRDGYYFQGTVYSERNLRAEKITVLGGVVATGTGSNGNVELIDMTLVQAPTAYQGGFALPHSVTIGGGDDSMRIRLSSRPDPTLQGAFLFYGNAWYGQHELGGDGYPDPTEDRWHLSLNPPQATILEGDPVEGSWPAPYTGKEADLRAQLQQLSNSDGSDYWPEISGYVNNLIENLSGRGTGVNILDLNFNNLLTPVDKSRILLFREISSR